MRLDVADGFVDGLGNVFHILGVQTTDIDSTILKKEDLMMLNEMVYLFWRQSGVAEHSNLLSDVIPSSWSSKTLQMSLQSCSHFLDS